MQDNENQVNQESSNSKTTIDKLLEINKIDSLISMALGEKAQVNKELENKIKTINEIKQKSLKLTAEFEEKQRAYKKQEDFLKSEQEKLVARRKALSTLNDSKSQIKAEKEVDKAAKQLSAMEEQLISQLDIIAKLENDSKETQELFISTQSSLEAMQAESEATFQTIDSRISTYEAEKKHLQTDVNTKDLNVYNRVSQRYQGSSMAQIEGKSCGGCYCSLSPQVIVQVSRMQDLITCQSCGRILYLKKE